MIEQESWCMLRIESQLNTFVGFVRRGFPLPLAQSVLGGIDHGMTAPHFDQLNCTIRRNRDVCSYDALEVHGAGEVGILRSHSGNNFACALEMILRHNTSSYY